MCYYLNVHFQGQRVNVAFLNNLHRILTKFIVTLWNRPSTVVQWSDYGLDNRFNTVRFPASVRDFSVLEGIPTRSGTYQASNRMGKRGAL